jgi:hypothetical protein
MSDYDYDYLIGKTIERIEIVALPDSPNTGHVMIFFTDKTFVTISQSKENAKKFREYYDNFQKAIKN